MDVDAASEVIDAGSLIKFYRRIPFGPLSQRMQLLCKERLRLWASGNLFAIINPPTLFSNVVLIINIQAAFARSLFVSFYTELLIAKPKLIIVANLRDVRVRTNSAQFITKLTNPNEKSSTQLFEFKVKTD